MSIVYLVVSEAYYGEKIRGVFSTLEKAQEYRRRRIADTNDKIDAIIIETAIDSPDTVSYASPGDSEPESD
jgi:hypothetical protein